MSSAMVNPSDEVLAALGLRLVKPLGGRRNHHWLVELDGESRVLRRWGEHVAGSIEYELSILRQVARLGYPVAPLEDPVTVEEGLWSLSPRLPGSPAAEGPNADPRTRGRLLAEFHAVTAELKGLGQRPGWRRCEAILADPALDATLSDFEAAHSEEVRIIRWHLLRARKSIEALNLADWPGILVHGDFTSWNLLFEGDRLTGVLDFELCRRDHRIADFALAWRGKYDAVIAGYHEVSPLSEQEREAIVPVWWAELVEGACRNLRLGVDDQGWTITKLLCRSKFMGPHAEALP